MHFLAQRNQSLFGQPARNLPKPADLGFSINPDLATGPPTLDFSSGLRTGFVTGPTVAANNTIGASDALSWIHGRSTWKFGAGISAWMDLKSLSPDFVLERLSITYDERALFGA